MGNGKAAIVRGDSKGGGSNVLNHGINGKIEASASNVYLQHAAVQIQVGGRGYLRCLPGRICPPGLTMRSDRNRSSKNKDEQNAKPAVQTQGHKCPSASKAGTVEAIVPTGR